MNPINLMTAQLEGFAEGTFQHSPKIAAAVLLLIVTWLVTGLARPAS